MGQPEKEPNDKPEPKESPKLDAILPDDLPPSAAELVDDIDSYQKRMEKEWDATKSAYEHKINHIMEEFLMEGMAGATPLHEHEEEKVPPKQKPEPKQTSSWKQSTPRDERLKTLLGQLEAELRRASKTTKRTSFLPGATPQVLQLPWQGGDWREQLKKFSKIFAPIILLIAASTWYMGMRTINVTPLPYAHSLGPIFRNDKIYILDWFRKALYVHANKKGLPILSVDSMPNGFATGFAISDKTIWTLDGIDQKILLHSVTSDHQVMSTVPSPDKKPVGLFYDGLDLWSADQEAKKLYRHRGNDIEDIRDTFPLPEIVTTAFVFYNNRLWLLDGKARLVNVYRLQKPLLQLASLDLDPFVKNAIPTGFAIEGKSIYVLTENPSTFIRVPLSRLKQSKTESY